MAYNNGFPVTYGQLYPPVPAYNPQQMQPQMQSPQMQQPQQNNMTWVQGETGAKSFLMQPNLTIPLWDSEAKIIYLKSTDASGMPSMKILDYTIRGENEPPKTPISDAPEYATKNDIESTKDDIKSTKDVINHELDVIKQENKDLKKEIETIKESLGL